MSEQNDFHEAVVAALAGHACGSCGARPTPPRHDRRGWAWMDIHHDPTCPVAHGKVDQAPDIRRALEAVPGSQVIQADLSPDDDEP